MKHFTGTIIGRLAGHDEFFHIETVAEPQQMLAIYAIASRAMQAWPNLEEVQINIGRDVHPTPINFVEKES